MENIDLRKLLKAANKKGDGGNAAGMEEEMATHKKSTAQNSQEPEYQYYGGQAQNSQAKGSQSQNNHEHDDRGQDAQANKTASNRVAGSKGRHGYLRGLLSGTFISESLILRDIRYSVLIALLAVIFIANRFNAERVEREIIVLEQEVRDMRSESLSVSAALSSVSRQSEITELVKERGLGLQELREPPFRIVVHE